MKKLLLLIIMMAGVVIFAGCRRPHVKHDHGTKVMSIRIPKDTLKEDDYELEEEAKEDWQDEDLISIPDAPEDAKAEAHPEVREEIERMMRGEE